MNEKKIKELLKYTDKMEKIYVNEFIHLVSELYFNFKCNNQEKVLLYSKKINSYCEMIGIEFVIPHISNAVDLNSENFTSAILQEKIKSLDLDVYEEKTRLAIIDSLETIYYANQMGQHKSNSIIRKNFEKINKKIIDKAITKYQITAKNTKINNPTRYLATSIYNAINEVAAQELDLSIKLENYKSGH